MKDVLCIEATRLIKCTQIKGWIREKEPLVVREHITSLLDTTTLLIRSKSLRVYTERALETEIKDCGTNLSVSGLGRRLQMHTRFIAVDRDNTNCQKNCLCERPPKLLTRVATKHSTEHDKCVCCV
jgi:hypothetical protein